MNHIDHATDAHGAALVRVYFATRKPCAVLYRHDYERLCALIGTAKWFLNSNGKGNLYVRARDPATRRNVMIARLILGVEHGAIRHQDGDSLNLRRENLVRPHWSTVRSIRRLTQ